MILGCAALLLAAALPGAKADKPAKLVDALLMGLGGEREPGAAIMVLRDGAVVYLGTRGAADLQAMRPIDGRTNFRLASLSKAFTAAAVALLVRDGKLRYEDRLTDLLPGFPEYGRAITVRHLLDHTSGLPDYEGLMPAADPGRPVEESQIDDAGVLEILRGQKAGWFVPGSIWRYSNSGYVVLGLIVARVSGRSFPTFLRERVFQPLKMTGTVALVRGKTSVADRAFGYTKDGGRWRFTDQSPTSATLGDGGVYSTVEDLAKWDEALRASTLVSPAWMKPALTPATLADGSATRWPAEPGDDNLMPGRPVSYGFGWFLDSWRGHPRMWHHGSTSGFRSVIERFPDSGLTVVILANRDDLDVKAVALEVSELYLAR
jgi:CubicO group peptidase (beta-lactamase class C family)